MGDEACDEDLQRLGEFVGVISRHNREIKKFEDWLSEAVPLKFEKVSDMSSVKLKAGVMASVPLSFFFFWWRRNGLYWFSFRQQYTFCWCWCGGCCGDPLGTSQTC